MRQGSTVAFLEPSSGFGGYLSGATASVNSCGGSSMTCHGSVIPDMAIARGCPNANCVIEPLASEQLKVPWPIPALGPTPCALQPLQSQFLFMGGCPRHALPEVQTLTGSVYDGDDYFHHSEEQTENPRAKGLSEVTELLSGRTGIWTESHKHETCVLFPRCL